MWTWLYIIYFNLFNQNNINAEPFHILFDENNQKYCMINMNDLLNQNLTQTLSKQLDNVNYFEMNEFIGLHDESNKDALIVTPYNYMKELTDNIMITGVLHKIKNKKDDFTLVPFKTVIKSDTTKGTILKNKIINLNNKGSITKNDLKLLYLNKVHTHKSIPIYLLGNKINDIKVSMRVS